MTTTVTPKLTTFELMTRLQRHYIKPGQPLPGGVFIPECGWNGGGNRVCDAIYVGFTSSSGRILIGHEVKTSRADWLRELDQPDKADQWADQCHAWYLVVSDPLIVQGDELPAGWGLMVPGTSKTRMTVVTKAQRKPANHQPSWDVARSLLARQDTLRASIISKASRDAHDQARRDYEKRQDERSDALMGADKAHLAALRANMAAIEDALGSKIDFTDAAGEYGNRVGLADIRAIASLVRAHRDVERASAALIGKWANPTGRARHALDRLDEALKALRTVVATGEDRAHEQ